MKHTTQRGIALLIAVLISAVAIAVGAAIYSIVQKQLILTGLSRDSQFAFYAADSAAECALYWDNRYGYFAATTTIPGSPAICSNNTLAVTRPGNATYPYISTFQYDTNGLCAVVSVVKCDGTITDPVHGTCVSSGSSIHTTIIAYGYNVACSATSSSLRVLQRAVRLNY